MGDDINPKYHETSNNNIYESKKKDSRSQFFRNTKKYLKKFLKYFSISVIAIIVIYFIVFFIKKNSLKSLEKPRVWKDSTISFEVTLTTSFRYDDIWDEQGMLLYKIYLEGDTNKYNYNNYDGSQKIVISFLDKEDFMINQREILMSDFIHIIDNDNNNETIGFSKRGSWFSDINDYKLYNSIDVSWNVKFESK